LPQVTRPQYGTSVPVIEANGPCPRGPRPCQRRRYAKGVLRIYLGAAPGVGKTYAMLAEAQRKVVDAFLAAGIDVITTLNILTGED